MFILAQTNSMNFFLFFSVRQSGRFHYRLSDMHDADANFSQATTGNWAKEKSVRPS